MVTQRERVAGAHGHTAAGIRAATPKLKRVPWGVIALLAVVWALPPLLPEGLGLRFGRAFQLFFTAALVFSVAVFWLLDQEHIPQPKSTAGVLGSIALVYVATVGFLVAVAVAAPQFALPRPGDEVAAADAAKRGEALFWKPEAACFQCHTIAGRGGTRGPELSRAATVAGSRVPGLAAEQYLREKVMGGAAYPFKVPGYVPMMPAFGQALAPDQIDDLVTYLLTLK